jgi:tRNA threonylcarbamoyladenosine biosynthesis protein TsaE
MLTWQIRSLDDINSIAVDLLAAFPDRRVFAFFGEMGAGKTTLIRGLCHALGVKENVSSPTFSLINEYAADHGNLVYHFDFYRIEKEQEAVELGCTEYFYSGNYCFIEWSEKILHLLPEDSVRLSIRVNNETRIITTQNDRE